MAADQQAVIPPPPDGSGIIPLNAGGPPPAPDGSPAISLYGDGVPPAPDDSPLSPDFGKVTPSFRWPAPEQEGPPKPAKIKASENLKAGMDRYQGMPEGYEPQTGAPQGLLKPIISEEGWNQSPEDTRFLSPEQKAGVTSTPTGPGAPYVPTEADTRGGQILGGVFEGGARALRGAADFPLSPGGAALTALTGGAGALAPLAGILTSATFGADMAAHFPDQWARVQRAAENYGQSGDAQPLAGAITDLLSSGALVYAMGRHAVGEPIQQGMEARANEQAIPGAVADAAGSVDALRAVRDKIRAQRQGLDQSAEDANWRQSVNSMEPPPAPDGSEAIPVGQVGQVLARAEASRRFQREPPRQGPVSPQFAGEAAPRGPEGIQDLSLGPEPQAPAVRPELAGLELPDYPVEPNAMFPPGQEPAERMDVPPDWNAAPENRRLGPAPEPPPQAEAKQEVTADNPPPPPDHSDVIELTPEERAAFGVKNPQPFGEGIVDQEAKAPKRDMAAELNVPAADRRVTPEEFDRLPETERRAAYRKALEDARVAETDPTTGLGTKVALQRHIDEFPDHHTAVLDMDGLKKINDTHGHQIGDQLIKVVGDAAKAIADKTDGKAFRYGGDEFVIRAKDRKLLEKATERIQAAVDSHDFEVTDAQGQTIRVKAGISYGIGGDFESADRAQYANKRGRAQSRETEFRPEQLERPDQSGAAGRSALVDRAAERAAGSLGAGPERAGSGGSEADLEREAIAGEAPAVESPEEAKARREFEESQQLTPAQKQARARKQAMLAKKKGYGASGRNLSGEKILTGSQEAFKENYAGRGAQREGTSARGKALLRDFREPAPVETPGFSPEDSERQRAVEEQDAAARAAEEAKAQAAIDEKNARPEIKGKQIGLMGEDDRGIKGDQRDLELSKPAGITGTDGMTPEMRQALEGKAPKRGRSTMQREALEAPPEPAAPIKAALEFKDDLHQALSPATKTEQTRAIGGSIRQHGAEAALRTAQTRAGLKRAFVDIGKLSPDEKLDFVDRIEKGEKDPDPKLEGYAKAIRQELDSRREIIRGFGEGKLESYVENYFPHAWKDVKKAQEWIDGRRPMEGSKSFLKKRSIPLTRDGVEAGLQPLYDNPIEQVLHTAADMDRYIAGHAVKKDADAMGLRQFVPADNPDIRRAGYVISKDPGDQVWGKSSVPVEESHDEMLHSGLEKLAKDLGVEHTRVVPRPGGPMGVALGKDTVVTKFASDMGTLTHEIGHAIDHKFGAYDFITHPPDSPTKAAGLKLRGQINSELRALVDHSREEVARGQVAAGGKLTPQERSGFEGYIRKKSEKMARMLDSYINSRDLMREVAPHVMARLEEFIDAHPQLAPLKKLRPSLVGGQHVTDMPIEGRVLKGQYAYPKEVAQLIDTWLAPGLEGKAAFRGVRALANSVVQAKLGWSGFHGTFTATTTPIDQLALAFKNVADGKFGEAGKAMARMPLAPFLLAREGARINRGAMAGEMSPEIGALLAGGHRFKTEYTDGMVERFKEAMAAGNYGRAALRAPLAATELMAKPLMEHFVPAVKTGAAAQLARYELDRLGPDAQPAEVQWAMGRAIDSVDNRFGQLVRDNLFWGKKWRDLAGLAVQSPGWNIGDFRELGGAGFDVATGISRRNTATRLAGEHEARASELEELKQRQEDGELDRAGAARMRQLEQRERMSGRGLVDPTVTHRMAFAAALPVVAGFIGGTMNYLMTGEAPKELKDLYFPRTGNKRPDGSDERLTLPTYMRDVYSFAKRPVQTVINKAHPLVSSVRELAENKDWRGNEILHPDDPWYKIVGQFAEHLLKTYEPMSLENASRSKDSGDSKAQQILAAVGAPRAPRYITESPAEAEMTEYQAAHRGDAPRTQVQADRSDTMHKAEQMYRMQRPQEGSDELRKGVKGGYLGAQDIDRVSSDLQRPVSENRFRGLPLDEKLKVYELANDAEKARFKPLITDTVSKELQSGSFEKKSPADMKDLTEKLRRVYGKAHQ